MAKIKYRLGLDLGANSLGWCVYQLDDKDEPVGIHRLGVRIFSDGRDPKSLASKAADRRLARQMRRRRDRVLKRRHRLIAALVRYGLMPTDGTARKLLQSSDPYELRARGLEQILAPHELGRALYHLARKRGFKSSRKDGRDPDAEKESGKVNSAIHALRERISAAGCRTVGEYLAKQHQERRPVRARRTSDGQYVLYLQRDMVAEEFDALWSAQQHHHPGLLNEQARSTLRDIMLFQRRLLPVAPGRCLFETGEARARLCSPLQQRFRILQELNNLRVKDGIGQRPLTLDERARMLARMETDPGLVTFSELAKSAGLRNAKAFNFANDEKRRGFKGDAVAGNFASENAFGARWREIPDQTRHALAVLVEQADQVDALIEALLALPGSVAPAATILGKQHDTESLVTALAKMPFHIEASLARTMAGFKLPDDYGSLSVMALGKIVPELEREVITYDVAVTRAGYDHHSQFYQGEFHQRLPYYGELLRGYTSPADKAKSDVERQFGKIPNPTVHIGLNQLRQLVNALIKRYGHPHQIVIELTREFGVSGEKRREIMKRQTESQERNEEYDRSLAAQGVRTNRENRLKLQLWKELGKDDALDRYCVYSGKRLGRALLFSDEIEIDHILPFSRSLHDGNGNKILCVRQSNRDKGNRTPHEAFGHTDHWGEIVERASRLPGRKALLFREHALEDFLEGKDFLDRHLGDTAYLGRAAKRYLSAICPPNCIWVSSGKLTGMLRGKWGLNPLLSDDSRKNREDHRHHALDAAVIGTCSRSLIKRMATAAARAETHGENRLLEGLELPWSAFRDDLRTRLSQVVVSFKPDHGKEAGLHNETNYGMRDSPDKRGNPLVGHRVPLDSFSKTSDGEGIADEALRKRISDLLAPLSSAKDIKAAMALFTEQTGIRRVLVTERLSVIPIRDRRSGLPYRYVKGDGNYCYEIFRQDDGRWSGEVISLFEANQQNFVESDLRAQNGRQLVMRIRKDDVLLIELEGAARPVRVAKFSEGMIALVDHQEANVDARTRDKASGLKYIFKAPSALKAIRARVVGVDILGYVNDPGFRE